jgi:hypothetical protein
MKNADPWMRLRATAALVAALVALPHTFGFGRPSGAANPFDPDRLMDDVRAYYEFGVHRTAYPGDRRTSEWLAGRFRTLGLQTSAHAWPLRQFFLDEASIEDGEGQIRAFPLWLPRATGPDGLRARLVLVDGAAPAADLAGAIAWLVPGDRGGGPTRQALERQALEAGAAAVVFATSDSAGTGLLVAQNAERQYVARQRPIPTLTFGEADAARLRKSIGRDIVLRLTGRLDEAAVATNVLGRLVRREEADWIVVSTPSSGWFTCGGERGPGVAMLLALAEWATTRHGDLNYLFVANSGHELDYLGARLLHDAHMAPSPEKTRVWLHLGASIATPPWPEVDGVRRPADRVTTGTLQAAPELAPIMRRAFAGLPMYKLSTDTRIGEFRDLAEHGYRGLGVVGGSNPWFHVERDDPSAVSADTLAAVSRAAAAALEAIDRP